MDHMLINDNNEDLMSNDNMFPEELKISDKWQMEMNPAVNDNTGMDIFNESDISSQFCRNSIQVNICSK